MSVSATMEVATTTVLTLMEVMFAPALAATSLTVTDTHVKVGTSIIAIQVRSSQMQSDQYVIFSAAIASLTAVLPLPPTNLQISNISTRAATLSWQAPVVSFLNSLTAVSSYQVIAMQGQFPNVSNIRVDVGAGVTNYTFPHSLEEYTVYACTMKARNTFGLGSATQPVDLRTLQAGEY